MREYPPAEELSRLQRLVDAMMPNVSVIHDGCFDFVVWNEAFARVRTDPGVLRPERRNLLWWMFTVERNRAMMRRWEPAARAVLSQFRAIVGSRPDDQRLELFQLRLVENPDLLLVAQLPATEQDHRRIMGQLAGHRSQAWSRATEPNAAEADGTRSHGVPERP
ncbi:hypothetical protein ACLMAL_17830 [Nocardia sp. CWNU-33]|uniref:MmyB family transcriptional regulator n=1 Tax=Nocardia sp. CWNU-33 TaxID=3392117 RepID=UPI00398F6018